MIPNAKGRASEDTFNSKNSEIDSFSFDSFRKCNFRNSCFFKKPFLFCPADRIRDCLDFWQKIEAPSVVLNILKQGYFLPFCFLPLPKFFENNKSALSHKDFVEKEIFELFSKNCILEVEQSFICNPLSVAIQSSGKKRLILDLRYVNRALEFKNVKFEDLRTAQKFLSPQGWMFSFDMKSGYHHVLIAPNHQKYLGFSWDFGYGNRYFVFRVLPFGLSAAPWLFTKLMRPLVKYWRSLGYPIVLYLDDALCFAPSQRLAVIASETIQTDLKRAGILENEEKSVWTPTQRITWLGLEIDLINSRIEIPLHKRQRAFDLANSLFKTKPRTARSIAKFAGFIMSFWLPLGNLVKLMTKNLYALIESRHNWDSELVLTREAKTELLFWIDNILFLPGKNCFNPAIPEKLILTDASSTGCGAVLAASNSFCFRKFNALEMKQSSTARELIAIIFALHSFKASIANKTLLLFTDNQACAKIIESGSMKPDLQALALEIFSFSLQNNVNLDPRWIPRELNEEADCLSKFYDSDDWSVRPLFFRYFDKLWGPHTFDRFADNTNAKLPLFNSRFHNPGTAGIDAFAFDWSDSANNWLVPPVHLISRTVQHLVACKAKGTLVCPKWPSASFWPNLFPFGASAKFILDIVEIPKNSSLFLPSSQPTSIFNKANFPSPVLFLRLKA